MSAGVTRPAASTGLAPAHRLAQAVDAAQAAAGRAGDMRGGGWPGPWRAVAGQPEAQLDALLMLDRLAVEDVVDGGDQALIEGKADGEILEVGRARHHHGIGAAVEDERDRRLLGHGALAGREDAIAPGEAGNAGEAAVIGRDPPAATPPIGRSGAHRGSLGRSRAMRRDCLAKASYSSCHCVGPLDGMTCTAVTLYSGQLVAQSE